MYTVQIFKNNLGCDYVGRVYTFGRKNDAEGCAINLNSIFASHGLNWFAEIKEEEE